MTRSTGLALALFLALPAAATAQAAGTYVPSAAADSMLVLVEMRATADIEHDLQDAAARRAAAEVSETQAKLLQSRAATRIQIKETEIAALKVEIEQAKAQKDAARVAEVEGKQKLAKLENALLKKRLDLREREIDFAAAEAAYFAALAQSFERELELAHLRAQRADLVAGGTARDLVASAQKLAAKITETEGKTLDAKVEAAQKQKSLAEKSVAINRARKQVYAAQQKLIESAAKGA